MLLPSPDFLAREGTFDRAIKPEKLFKMLEIIKTVIHRLICQSSSSFGLLDLPRKTLNRRLRRLRRFALLLLLLLLKFIQLLSEELKVFSNHLCLVFAFFNVFGIYLSFSSFFLGYFPRFCLKLVETTTDSTC